MLKFLTLNFQAGAEYSSISTARSALTSLTGSMNGSTLRKQPLLQRYIKKFLICTVFPKCTITWKQLPQIISALFCLLKDQRDKPSQDYL